MNFDSEKRIEEDVIHDKSFLSSSSSNVGEEKLSVQSECLASNVLIMPSKSTPAIDRLSQSDKVIGQRKHLSAH